LQGLKELNDELEINHIENEEVEIKEMELPAVAEPRRNSRKLQPPRSTLFRSTESLLNPCLSITTR
jgi:hypothetical protein